MWRDQKIQDRSLTPGKRRGIPFCSVSHSHRSRFWPPSPLIGDCWRVRDRELSIRLLSGAYPGMWDDHIADIVSTKMVPCCLPKAELSCSACLLCRSPATAHSCISAGRQLAKLKSHRQGLTDTQRSDPSIRDITKPSTPLVCHYSAYMDLTVSALLATDLLNLVGAEEPERRDIFRETRGEPGRRVPRTEQECARPGGGVGRWERQSNPHRYPGRQGGEDRVGASWSQGGQPEWHNLRCAMDQSRDLTHPSEQPYSIVGRVSDSHDITNHY